MRTLVVRCGLLAAFALALAGCAESDTPDETGGEVDATDGRGGRGAADAGSGSATDGDAGADTSDLTDGGTDDTDADTGEVEPTEDTGQTDTTGGGCAAGTLDEAIACQIDANDAFVAAFCDCFADAAYDGDRAACEADQPGADAFTPDACSRAALLTDEAGSVRTSLCYADAAFDLADCVATCPPDEATFEACFDAVGAAFDACDADRPVVVAEALEACTDDPGTGGGGGDGTATSALRDQRDDYVTAYCGCAVGSEFADLATCRRTLEGRWDPGLSACEADVFEAMPEAAAPFITCITESFVIAETACMECPAPGSIEFDLCTDPAVDINFCFMDADPSLQDALLACPR